MTHKLTGRVALVTGAGAGIGAASAIALAQAGAHAIVSDINGSAAEAVAQAIRDSGGSAVAAALDVASEEDWATVTAQIDAESGPISILHSNAALTSQQSLAADLLVTDLDLDVFDKILGVNLRGAVLSCKYVIPHMLTVGRGSIILTSSVKGSTGSAHRTAYSVSKGGVDSLVKVIATGYGKSGIRCNAIAPGIVETDALTFLDADRRHQLATAHLTPGFARPGDIASAVAFLASDSSAFITGQVINVDGGLTAHTPALSPDGSRGE